MIPKALSRNTTATRIRAANRPYLADCSMLTLLKFVARPKLHVVDVAAGRCLFEKFAGIEDAVIRLKICVTVDLPADFSARTIADKACAAPVGRNEQKSRNGVTPFFQVPPPLDHQIRDGRNAVAQLCLNLRMNVDEIDGTGPRVG